MNPQWILGSTGYIFLLVCNSCWPIWSLQNSTNPYRRSGQMPVAVLQDILLVSAVQFVFKMSKPPQKPEKLLAQNNMSSRLLGTFYPLSEGKPIKMDETGENTLDVSFHCWVRGPFSTLHIFCFNRNIFFIWLTVPILL